MSSSSSITGERKRSRKEMEDASNRVCNNSNAQVDDDQKAPLGPLQGVIACLSGLAQDRKEELHRLIISLGGRYAQSC